MDTKTTEVNPTGQHKGISMPYVSSSAISRIEWNKETLSVWFHKTGRYDYYGVPDSLYHRFLDARSKGQFFNENIRDQYGQ